MVKLPTELNAGSPYSMKVEEIDSAVRFSNIIIEKAKNSIALIEKNNWDEAKEDILWIIRSLNHTNVNYQHMRQMIYGRKLENLLVIELKRLSKDATVLIGQYKQIQKTKNKPFEQDYLKENVESLLRDIINHENLLERVFSSFKTQFRRSKKGYYAGIISGGSSCRCTIIDEEGNTVGFAVGGPGHRNSLGLFKAISTKPCPKPSLLGTLSGLLRSDSKCIFGFNFPIFILLQYNRNL